MGLYHLKIFLRSFTMRSKFFVLGAIIATCVATIAFNQSVADELHPNMQGGKRPCYPSTKCTGDPNMIGPTPGNCPAGCYSNADGGGPCPSGHSSGGSFSSGEGNYAPPGTSVYGPSTGKVLRTESSEKYVGTVKSIDRIDLPDGTQVQMMLTTERGDLQVILGPANYLDQQKIKFSAGDKVTVIGYPIKANDKIVIVASEIKRNGSALRLLNEKRQPLWSQSNNQMGGRPTVAPKVSQNSQQRSLMMNRSRAF